jgi:hypothetical protein
VFLATYRELRAGELFELTLEFDTGAAVTIPACVRWVRGASELGEPAGVGFEFTLVSPGHAVLLLGAQHAAGSLYVEL